MKLSIITVCFNEKEIRRTCESICGQTWQDFEWIVVDGGSTDGTLDILNEYKYRINLLISEKDDGIYDAMNKGILHAKGKWLSFMNGGDCFYDNSVLEKVFEKSKYDLNKYAVLYGHTFVRGKNKISKRKQIYFPFYFLNNVICHQSAFVKREAFDKYGLYNKNLKIYADHEKWVQMITHGEKFKLLDICISDFNSSGISSNKKYEKLRKHELQEIVDNHYNKFYIYMMKFRNLFSIKRWK